MKIIETKIKGVFSIDIEPIEDDRGFFARTWCKKELEKHNIKISFVQSSISFNKQKGTIRGLHYQTYPYEEEKLIQCTKGSIHDVAVDLRKNSPTYASWVSIKLSEINKKSFFIPKGVAHGFQTLEDNTEILYNISEYYHPKYAHGIHWNDEYLNISWPLPINTISPKDLAFPTLKKETNA